MTEFEECKTCYGWCCSAFSFIALREEDIERIADYLDYDVDKFKEIFVYPERRFDVTYLKSLSKAVKEGKRFRLKGSGKPCMFWQYGKCAIHPVKPKACADYGPTTSFPIYSELTGEKIGERTCAEWHRGLIGFRDGYLKYYYNRLKELNQERLK